jgi:hypothetical protein
LIRRGAIAGGVAWTAPMIVGSLASPAGALSPTDGYPCSYITVVYTYGGNTYAAKFNHLSSVCAGNTTSGDSTFTYLCNGVQYTNTCSGTAVCADGAAIASDPSCASRVSYAGGTTITAAAGVTIIFAVAHDGSYDGNKFRSICPSSPLPANSVTAPECGSS